MHGGTELLPCPRESHERRVVLVVDSAASQSTRRSARPIPAVRQSDKQTNSVEEVLHRTQLCATLSMSRFHVLHDHVTRARTTADMSEVVHHQLTAPAICWGCHGRPYAPSESSIERCAPTRHRERAGGTGLKAREAGFWCETKTAGQVLRGR